MIDGVQRSTQLPGMSGCHQYRGYGWIAGGALAIIGTREISAIKKTKRWLEM